MDAWKFVAEGQKNNKSGNTGAADAIDAFASNWTSQDFVKFVGSLQELVDGLGIALESGSSIQSAAVLDRVIELEIEFWPELKEISGAVRTGELTKLQENVV